MRQMSSINNKRRINIFEKIKSLDSWKIGIVHVDCQICLLSLHLSLLRYSKYTISNFFVLLLRSVRARNLLT